MQGGGTERIGRKATWRLGYVGSTSRCGVSPGKGAKYDDAHNLLDSERGRLAFDLLLPTLPDTRKTISRELVQPCADHCTLASSVISSTPADRSSDCCSILTNTGSTRASYIHAHSIGGLQRISGNLGGTLGNPSACHQPCLNERWYTPIR